MSVADVDLEQAQILIRSPKKDRHGKARHRFVYLNESAVAALASWLHLRGTGSDLQSLWLNDRQQSLTKTGIQQMLARRGRRLGFKVSAHQFRRRLATNWLLQGLSETGLMAMGGWRSPTMPSRYAAGALTEIARADHKRLSQGSGTRKDEDG
jgi:integrase/recombinase XerC